MLRKVHQAAGPETYMSTTLGDGGNTNIELCWKCTMQSEKFANNILNFTRISKI